MKNKIAIVVHGGAGPDSDHIKENVEGYQKGIEDAIHAGYSILEKGGSAVDAVEAAVRLLEDHPLFNAGRGSALTAKGEVEMCASIMNGKDLSPGAVAIVKNVRNPVSLARAVMEKTEHVYLGGLGALDYARAINLPLEPMDYFITEYRYGQYQKMKQQQSGPQAHGHGTVGAVALDAQGNLAAATSTGGTEFCKSGRIADSSMIGAGTYANNQTCAVSCTGDGEVLIQKTAAFHISCLVEYKGLSLPEACHYFMHEKYREEKGNMGMIALDGEGNIAVAFNSERMHRGWKGSHQQMLVAIYP